MTEQEYQNYCEFINKVLYELTTIEDYEIILNDIGIPIKQRGTENYRYLSGCHNINPTKPNLSFHLETRTFTCFSDCNCSMSLLNLVYKRFNLLGENKTKFQCMKYICNRLDIPFNFNEEVKRDRSNIYNWKNDLMKYVKGYHNTNIKQIYDKSILNYFPKIYHQDWLDFGISEETLDKYNIRWYNYRNQIVIPCYEKDEETNETNLIGIRVRNMDERIDMKYMPLNLLDGTQFNFPTNDYLYGSNFNEEEIRRTKTVWLVESEKSVLKGDTWFNEKNTTLGMYGHNFSNSNLKYLLGLGVETYYICLDSDFTEISYSGENEKLTEYEKFEKNVMKIYEKLKPYAKNIYVVYNNLGYKDMYKANCFDFDRERFDILVENKERIE